MGVSESQLHHSQAVWLGQDTFLNCILPQFLLLATIDNNSINLNKLF